MFSSTYNVEELRKERARRMEDAILCKKPDRVPFSGTAGYFAANYAGITCHEYDYDYDKNLKAALKVARDFDFDMFRAGFGGVFIPFPRIFSEDEDIGSQMFLGFGTIHDILGDKYTKWSGRELSVNTPSQIAYEGMPYMMAEEYDELIRDPVKFMSEKIVPRAFRNLEKPASPRSYATLVKLGLELPKIMDFSMKLRTELQNLGYPQFPSLPVFVTHPLDYIADALRGHTHIMVDLFKIPDKVLAAVEVLLDMAKRRIKVGKELWEKTDPQTKATFDSSIIMVSIPLHLNEMLSPRFFEKFYWEPMTEIVNEIARAGAITSLFFEGDFTPFLEYILDFPKGKVIAYFERADLRKARNVIGDHVAIMGGISASLFISGPPSKVYEETCKLLGDVKDPGGFIFSGTGVSIPSETKPENLRAAIDAVKKCGLY